MSRPVIMRAIVEAIPVPAAVTHAVSAWNRRWLQCHFGREPTGRRVSLRRTKPSPFSPVVPGMLASIHACQSFRLRHTGASTMTLTDAFIKVHAALVDGGVPGHVTACRGSVAMARDSVPCVEVFARWARELQSASSKSPRKSSTFNPDTEPVRLRTQACFPNSDAHGLIMACSPAQRCIRSVPSASWRCGCCRRVLLD